VHKIFVIRFLLIINVAHDHVEEERLCLYYENRSIEPSEISEMEVLVTGQQDGQGDGTRASEHCR